MTRRAGDLADYLNNTRLRELSSATYDLRVMVLRKLLRVTGRPGLLDITAADLQDWEQIAVVGRQPQTRRTYVSTVAVYFRWALRRGYIETDPSTILTIPKVRKGEPRPISEDDLELALLAAPTTGLYAMLRLMADAGLRCVEVAGFHRQDLDDTVKPNILFVREGKGSKIRRVPVGQAVRTAIIRTGVKAGPLFPKGNAYGRMTRVEVSRQVNRHLHGLGIPDTAHTLRHRHLTVAYQWTRDIRLCQALAGHESPATTAIYTRYSPQNADALIAHLDDIAGVA